MTSIDEHRQRVLRAAETGDTETTAWAVRDAFFEHGPDVAKDLVEDVRAAGFDRIADELTPPDGAL